jgi:tungstate transport system substrate-binding protein
MTRSGIARTQAAILVVLIVVAVAGGAYAYVALSTPTKSRLIVSTTTSLYESGLLDYLKTQFESAYPNMNVSFISQGTGIAIQTAMRGDADMILVHAPASELTFLKGGYGVNRKIIAYNFFLITGPQEDPAGIAGKNATAALKLIKAAGLQGKAVWISRADKSGTYSKEVSLWKSAGLNVDDLRKEPWYLEAGSGMTATLKMADEKKGYTLSDIATYLTNLKNQNINLAKLVESGKDLLNVYSAISDDPRNPNMTKSNFQGSMQFIRWLVSSDAQQLIGKFGVDTVGQAIFFSYLNLMQTQNDPQLIKSIQDFAFFAGYECPVQYQYQAGDLYPTQPAIIVPPFEAINLKKESGNWVQN